MAKKQTPEEQALERARKKHGKVDIVAPLTQDEEDGWRRRLRRENK